MLKLHSLRRGGLAYLLLALNSSLAADSFYREEAQGWFWYKEEPKPQEIEESPVPFQAPLLVESPLRAERLRIMIPKALDTALDDPTLENVQNYFLLQKMAMDKSEKFAQVAQELPLLKPEYDELGRREQSPRAAEVKRIEQNQQEQERLRQIAKGAGLFFYYKGECPYCRLVLRELNSLADLGFKVLGISLDGQYLDELKAYRQITDPKAAATIGVTSVPTIVLVVPDSQQKYAIIATSVLQDSELEARILKAAGLLGL